MPVAHRLGILTDRQIDYYIRAGWYGPAKQRELIDFESAVRKEKTTKAPSVSSIKQSVLQKLFNV